MSRLTLRLFGPPRVEVDGQPVEITRRKAQGLLAFLAVTQQSHSRDALATIFWPEASQSRARASLRSALWELNKTALAEWLDVQRDTVTLRAPGNSESEATSESELAVDILRFRQRLSAVQGHEHTEAPACPACIERLTEAVSLYEDDFLAGFTLPDSPAFDEWHFFQADSLRQELATALQRLIDFHRSQSEPDNAIPYARRLVALDPLHEPAQRTLMQLYAEVGQRSAVVRQYEICRHTLESELDVEPAPETKALYEAIQSGTWKADADQEKQAQERSPHATNETTGQIPHNLPLSPTPFVGREQELAALTALLEDGSTRLITITGPGGIGKTRLALSAASEQLASANFPEGIYFIPLAPVSDAEAIIPAIAEAIGFPFQPDERSPRQQIFDFLSQKSALLLLDNFEHLLGSEEDGALLVTGLLQQAPALKVLTTSREPLNLYEEQRYPLQGLEHGAESGTESPAAALFLQTVRRHRPNFELAPGDHVHLANICHLVGGMPLALELAASWIEILSLSDIAAEIRHNLDLMETTMRNVPARHRSMQAVFDRSWQTLSEKEQEVYAQLSVFRGGFTEEAAIAVSGASRLSLAALVQKSLLRFNPHQSRYEHHELLRQYAAEKLGQETEETRMRHAAYYSRFLQQREDDLKGGRQQEALAEVEADSKNVAAAWHWSVAQSRFSYVAKALVPLGLYYKNHGRYEEGATRCQQAVEQLTVTRAADSSQMHLLVKLLTWQAHFMLLQGHYEQARQLLTRAQTVLDQLQQDEPDVVASRAFLLLHLADPFISNDYGGRAMMLNEESLQLYRTLNDLWGTSLALDALSQKKMNVGLQEKAIQLHEECLAIRQRLEDRQGVARSYSLLGLFHLHTGQLDQSEAYLRESLSLFRKLDNRATLSVPLALLGINLLFAGRFEESIAAYEEAWTIHRTLGITREPSTANTAMTRDKINLGRYTEARAQAETDLVTYRTTQQQWDIAFTLFNLGRLDLVEGAARRAQQRFEESVQILQKMKAHSLLPEVLSSLAYAHLASQEPDQALEYIIQALKLAIAGESLNTMRFELPAMALLLAHEGQAERVVEYYAAARQSPYIANSQWFEDIAGRRIKGIATALPKDAIAAAEERGRARDLKETAHALLAELSGDN